MRIAGYGYPSGFFRSIRQGGKEFLIHNEKFSLRFFPPELARWPSSFKFAADKPADTCRIFVFGESAAMGDPQPAFSASRYLEVLLRRRFPGQKFEIVNLGITAINSHVILPMAQDCARQHADIWIIYMGNNEMVGPFGAATVFGSRAPPLAAAKLNLALKKTRVGQLAGAWIQLKWSSPVSVSKVILYDRPNLTDNVKSGTLLFSDGTSLSVGQLPNDAKTGYTVTFATKTISWVKFTVGSAVGQNIGLAEFQVIAAGP